MTSTPMQAPNYGQQQGASLSDSMQAVYDSILKDEEARFSNATRQSQLPEALSKFSKTAYETGTALFTKKLQDTEAKALYDARMDGTISQDQVDAYDAEVAEIEETHQIIDKGANAIEKQDRHDIVSEHIRSTDPYYQYYYKLGQLRNQVRDLPLLHSQLKETLTIDSAFGQPLNYNSINNTEDMARWNAKAETYMMRAFAGVNPVLAKKEVFPTVDEIFTNDSNRFATANAKRHREERISLEQDKLTAGLISKDQAQLNLAMQNHNLSRKDLMNWMENLARSNALDDGLYEMLGEAKVRDRTTGQLVAVSEKFKTEYFALAGIVQKARLDQYSMDSRERSNALIRHVEEEVIPSFENDPDGVTKANIDEAIEALSGDPDAGRAIELLQRFKLKAVDHESPEQRAALLEKGMQQIENGIFGWKDIEARYANHPKVLRQLKNFMTQFGMKEGQDTITKEATTELLTIEDWVKKAANVSDLTASDGTVRLEIRHQQSEYMRDVKAFLALGREPHQARSEALAEFYKRWEKLIKTEGYVSPDGYPGAIQRLSPDVQVQASISQRIDTAKNTIEKNTGSDRLANYEKFYTPEQFNKATEQWRNGEVDAFTTYVADLTNLTPYQVLNEINKKMFNVDLPIPQPIGEIVQQLTPEQRRSINRFPSAAKIGRYTGQPFSVVSPVARSLPFDYRQRGNEMLNYMTNDLGMSRIHAVGLLVNAERESSLKTSNPGDNGESNGLFQWNMGRLSRARAALGNDWDNWKAQIKYALEEANEPGQEYLNTQFSSPQEAADWWMRYWERPAHPERDSEVHRKYIPYWL